MFIYGTCVSIDKLHSFLCLSFEGKDDGLRTIRMINDIHRVFSGQMLPKTPFPEDLSETLSKVTLLDPCKCVTGSPNQMIIGFQLEYQGAVVPKVPFEISVRASYLRDFFSGTDEELYFISDECKCPRDEGLFEPNENLFLLAKQALVTVLEKDVTNFEVFVKDVYALVIRRLVEPLSNHEQDLREAIIDVCSKDTDPKEAAALAKEANLLIISEILLQIPQMKKEFLDSFT